MKIIDWERKGNYVRFYLGDDADTTYTGEDWDELHYEENAGPVDPDHVKGHADLILPVGWAVREPCNANWGYGWGTSPWSKNDLKEGAQPCLIAVPPVRAEDSGSFAEYPAAKWTIRYYVNDRMDPGVILPDYLMPKDEKMAWKDILPWKKPDKTCATKVIDWEREGHVVRFLLGDRRKTDYWGDDWDDAPYEYNAERVYQEYIRGEMQMVFPFNWDVLEPSDRETWNSPWSKEDMKAGRVPCLLAVPPKRQIGGGNFVTYTDESVDKNGNPVSRPKEGVYAFYFGDPMQPDLLRRFAPRL